MKDKELSELHALLAKTLKDAIAGGEANAAVLNVARQFLKDNGVNSTPTHDPNLAALSETVPFTETDEYGLPN